MGEEPGQEPGGHSGEMQETLPAWGGEQGAGGGSSKPLPHPGGTIVRPSASRSGHPKALGEWGRGCPPPPGTHQAEADGAVAVGRGEDVAFGPDHPLVQAACGAGGSGGVTVVAGGGWGGWSWGSPEQLGQQPPAGAGSGWEQDTGQLTASQSTRPPCEGSGRRWLSPTSHCWGWGVMGGEDTPPPRFAYLAGAAPAPRLRPASAELPGSPPVPTARGRGGGSTGGSPGGRGRGDGR